jgi:ABC-2 type transport system ATP-binding protein
MGFDLKDQPSEIRRIISYLPEDAGAYKNLTGQKYLEFIANFFEPNKKQEMINRGIKIAD